MKLPAQERRLVCYPSPKYSELMKAYATINEMSKSEAGAIAVKTFIDNLPHDVKIRVVNTAKEMNQSELENNESIK
jgi:hypothetical protein